MKKYVLPQDEQAYSLDAMQRILYEKKLDPFFAEDVIEAIQKKSKVEIKEPSGKNNTVLLESVTYQEDDNTQDYTFHCVNHKPIPIDFVKLEYNEHDPKLKTYYLYTKDNEAFKIVFL